MGTTVSLSDYGNAVKWLQSNVGEKIEETGPPLRGIGWHVEHSHYYLAGSSAPYVPVFIVYIDNTENAVEFSLIFGNS
jgi:hypothetical protein